MLFKTFHLPQGHQFVGTACVELTPSHFLIVQSCTEPNPNQSWALIHVRLVGQNGWIVDAGDRTYFATQEDAYSALAQALLSHCQERVNHITFSLNRRSYRVTPTQIRLQVEAENVSGTEAEDFVDCDCQFLGQHWTIANADVDEEGRPFFELESSDSHRKSHHN